MNTISVTQLVRKMKTALQFEVGEVWVEGEVSNLREQRSGHRYFTIKDEGAQLPCALFKGRSGKQGQLLQDGRKVKLFGEITVYEPLGRAQMIVSKVQASGEGDLQAQFEALKKRLNAEGLFDQSIKQALPKFPKRIGLVTSPSGAALQDMLNVFSRRAPWVELFLYGVQVQGKGAERGIAKAIQYFNSCSDPVDLLIVGRGGGSIEDLWNFNEEVVARAISVSTIPIISAVGHEIDFTIADFVADERAPTPSAAAEIAVPDKDGLLQMLVNSQNRMSHYVAGRLEKQREKLDYLKVILENKSPRRIHEDRVQHIDELSIRLQRAYQNAFLRKEASVADLKKHLSYYSPQLTINRSYSELEQVKEGLQKSVKNIYSHKEAELKRLKNLLQATSPDATLARGYSITTNEDGSILTRKSSAISGERIKTRLLDGEVDSVIV